MQCETISAGGTRRRTRSQAKRKKTYLVGRHVSGHYSPTGRCTKGYVAFDLEDNELVFLKDQWRSVGAKHTELETYQELHKYGVKCIATVLAGGDVVDDDDAAVQSTISQRYLKMPRRKRPLERIHTRLVTREIARSLDDYMDSVELIYVCTQALVGMSTLTLLQSDLILILVAYRQLIRTHGRRHAFSIETSVWEIS